MRCNGRVKIVSSTWVTSLPGPPLSTSMDPTAASVSGLALFMSLLSKVYLQSWLFLVGTRLFNYTLSFYPSREDISDWAGLRRQSIMLFMWENRFWKFSVNILAFSELNGLVLVQQQILYKVVLREISSDGLLECHGQRTSTRNTR